MKGGPRKKRKKGRGGIGEGRVIKKREKGKRGNRRRKGHKEE